MAWPGPAMAEFLRQFIALNRMLEGGFVIEDRLVTLADIDWPILSVVGTVDEIAPAAWRARHPPGRAASPRSTSSPSGPVTSAWSSARRRTTMTWPTVAAWARWRDGEGELPGGDRADPRRGGLCAGSRQQVRDRVGYGVELARAG